MDVPLVAFQTQMQNRSVLGTQFPKSHPLPPVGALNRSFKSQNAARYAAFWHAVPQIALTLFPFVTINRSVLNRSVFKPQTQLNRKR